MRRCLQCAAELPPRARFCAQCGAPAGEATATTAAPFAASPGERRQVAVLFADIAGYTRLSSTLDPEETHRLLTRFFEHTDAIVVRLGGTVDKHIGDAVMAVFGAPIAHGNDVLRALRAAVDIHAAMKLLSAETGRTLATHIGIASGEVVAAATGSAAHHDYTVTGDAVNLASRLTALAKDGETVVSDDVQRAVAAFADAEPLGAVGIRGLADGVRAWKLIALTTLARSGSPLFGRDAERRRFAGLLERARDERNGTVALICTDPGIGKSRLAEALVEDAMAANAACHSATVLDFGAGQGRDAVHALVCSLLGVPAGESASTRRKALDDAIAQARVDADDEPHVTDLLLIPQRPGSLYEAMDNAARSSGKLRALVHIVERAAIAHPCVLLVEDIHWASAAVLDSLRAISASVRRSAILLTMTTRRDGDPVTNRWPREDIVRFDLSPLARADALALARAEVAASPDLAERCVERAQGNPLFLMQLLKSDSDEAAVPATIQSVVLARLDRLSPPDKAALQAAAVIGQRFPLALLRHLIGEPGYEPLAPVERDLVRAVGDDRALMMFTHALIRDGAYASLLHSARRERHRAAAQWYETRDPTLRAEHLDRAEDPRAAEAYLAAARAESAAMHTDAALGLVTRGLELQAPAEIRFALASLEGELHVELGRATLSIAAFERARDAASDDGQRSAAWIGIASGHRLTSAVSSGMAALDTAESLAAPAGLARQLAQIAYLRGGLNFARGEVDACRGEHERALELARQIGDIECEARALSGLADALYAQGRLQSAHAAFARCLEICDHERLTRLSLMNHCMVALIDTYFGRFDDALARLARARGMAREVSYRFAEVMCEEVVAWILVFAGRYDQALEPIRRGIALARAADARRFEAILQVCSAQIAWHQGRHDEGRRSLRDARVLSEQIGPQFAGPLVLGAMAILAETAAERRQALADGERLLAQKCVSHCYFGFYRAAVDAALAANEWSEAERYARLLEDYARPEPLPMVDFVVARARALAAAGRGQADRAAIEACRQRALAWNLPAYREALDAALGALT